MAANPDGLQAIRDALINELAAETARRAALVAAGNPAPASYQVGGKQVQWNEYILAMSQQIREWNAFIVAAGGDGGLYEVVIQGY